MIRNKNLRKTLLLVFSFHIMIYLASAQPTDKLWYKKPASVWTEALPVGNGRLGAMIYGGMNEELVQLNEATLWSGGPVSKSINPKSAGYLPQVRDALLKSDYTKAAELEKN